jgi:tetratricopeptide (TPR) repeat protein
MLLSTTPPSLAEAEGVLNTPGLEVGKSWQLLLARAAIRKQQNKEGPMRSDLLLAFDLAGDPQTLVGWFEGMRRVVVNPAAALAILDAVRPRDALLEWVNLSRAVTMLDEPSKRADGLAQLRVMAVGAKDPVGRANASKAAGSALSQDKKWDEAVTVLSQGLVVARDDYMLNNNIAYILCEELRRPADALPYAEKAAKTAPDSLEVIDTLATVQWALGQRERAVQTATPALRLRRADADKAALVEKMGRWKLQLGDKTGAAALLDTLREMTADNPTKAKDLQAKVDKLQQDIDAAR